VTMHLHKILAPANDKASLRTALICCIACICFELL
jgi:hypothetical protein